MYAIILEQLLLITRHAAYRYSVTIHWQPGLCQVIDAARAGSRYRQCHIPEASHLSDAQWYYSNGRTSLVTHAE